MTPTQIKLYAAVRVAVAFTPARHCRIRSWTDERGDVWIAIDKVPDQDGRPRRLLCRFPERDLSDDREILWAATRIGKRINAGVRPRRNL